MTKKEVIEKLKVDGYTNICYSGKMRIFYAVNKNGNKCTLTSTGILIREAKKVNAFAGEE